MSVFFFLGSWALNYHPTVFVSYISSPDLTVDYNGCGPDSNSFHWFHSELIMSVLHREGLWDNLRTTQILHQPAGELRHLQAHRGERAMAAVPILQRVLQEDLQEGRQGLPSPRRWWEGCVMHGWVQWHLPSQWRKRRLLHPGGTAQRLQLWPKRGVAGEPTLRICILFYFSLFFTFFFLIHFYLSRNSAK